VNSRSPHCRKQSRDLAMVDSHIEACTPKEVPLIPHTHGNSRIFPGLLALLAATGWAGALHAQAVSDSSITDQCQERVRQHLNVPSMARFTSATSTSPGDGTIEIRGRVEEMIGGAGHQQLDYECRMLRRHETWVADSVTLTRPDGTPANAEHNPARDSGSDTRD